MSTELDAAADVGELNSPEASKLNYALMRRTVADLFETKAWIYWLDMIVCMSIGYPAAIYFLGADAGSWQQVVFFIISGLAFYRLGTFMHEIVHRKDDELRLFKFVWNVANGVQLVTPSHFYESHIDHHNTGVYGTGRDGEYLPIGNGIWAHIANYLFVAAVIPGWTAIRFMFLTPLTIFPGIRRWAREHWSSFVINFRYRKLEEEHPSHWMWTFLEWWCCFRLWMVVFLIVTEQAPWYRLVQLYAMGSFIMALNMTRTMVSHRGHGDGDAMNHREQLLDSNTITGGWFTGLLFPLGNRYHALHHLFPGLPYHNLGIAHRRLVKVLPPDAPYRQTIFPSYWSCLWANLRDARQEAQTGGAKTAGWYARREEQLRAMHA